MSRLLTHRNCLTYKPLPFRENKQKTTDTPSSAQLRESSAEFECHLPLAYLLPFPSVNQQLTAYGSENTFYLLIIAQFLQFP